MDMDASLLYDGDSPYMMTLGSLEWLAQQCPHLNCPTPLVCNGIDCIAIPRNLCFHCCGNHFGSDCPLRREKEEIDNVVKKTIYCSICFHGGCTGRAPHVGKKRVIGAIFGLLLELGPALRFIFNNHSNMQRFFAKGVWDLTIRVDAHRMMERDEEEDDTED